MGLSFLAIFNDFWRIQTTDYYCRASESQHFFFSDDFFFQLGDPKKVGPVIVQNNFFEKIAQSCHILRDLF
jgi:hypothetical protein